MHDSLYGVVFSVWTQMRSFSCILCVRLYAMVCRVSFEHRIYVVILVYYMIRYKPFRLNLCKTYHFTRIIDHKSHVSCQNAC